MKETLDEIRTMVESLRSGHYDCEDCWYSCPKSDHCCDDTAGDECNCGADDQNSQAYPQYAESKIRNQLTQKTADDGCVLRMYAVLGAVRRTL